MADQNIKDQQEVYPSPQKYNNGNHDEESATIQSKELHKKKRMKRLAYILAFIVFQTGIILLFSSTIMKIRTPKFRVRSAAFESFEVGTAANPAFNFRMNAELGIKNTNFGNYKFQNAQIVFYYDGIPVGKAIFPGAEAGWRTTKKLKIAVDLSSDSLALANTNSKSQLGNDINSGVLKLNAQSKLSGKVRVTFIFMKKKSANMNCTLAIGLADTTVREINCQ
ncbi:hypothetical protein ACH5RR_019730 [Cinchona calisaya]|uniref:Late embryogenesis abundant protein LEA-2 subgroup domain-containing protein n=1 Tax=Cinchona calisaya TaxID=153742 RepID=A0ABD2ZQ85_9GENT